MGHRPVAPDRSTYTPSTPLPTGMTWAKEPDRYKVSDRVTAFTSTDGGLILAPPSPGRTRRPRSTLRRSQCDEQITLTWMSAVATSAAAWTSRRNREWSHGKIVVVGGCHHREIRCAVPGTGARRSWMDLSCHGHRSCRDQRPGIMARPTTSVCGPRTTSDLYGPWASARRLSWKSRLEAPASHRSLNVGPGHRPRTPWNWNG